MFAAAPPPLFTRIPQAAQIVFVVAKLPLVGGLAVWFAVTAPSGAARFPWHTALFLVAEKINAAISGAVQTNAQQRSI
jgi:uncharacterized membrane-anchored protein YjiN (DUF445 family)